MLSKTSTLATGLLFVAAATTCFGDSWGPYRDCREVDPTGRYYVVIKKTQGWADDPGRGGPVEYVLAEGRQDSATVVSARDRNKGYLGIAPNPNVKVRPGDQILGTGKLKRAPRVVVVSSSGLGFAALDVHGYNYGDFDADNAIIIVSRDGEVKHRKSLADLLTRKEATFFTATAGGIWWLHGAWIDELNRRVVVVGQTYETPYMAIMDQGKKRYVFRTVSFDTGAVARSSEHEIIIALRQSNPGALELALELVGEMKLPDAKKDVLRIYRNVNMPLAVRLRAAVALGELGDKRGGPLVAEAAAQRTEADDPTRAYAIRHLVELLGPDATPILRDVATDAADIYEREIWLEFGEVGRSAIPVLIELVKDDSHPHAQYVAAECLSDLGPAAKDAIPFLIRLVERPRKSPNDPNLPFIAAYALEEIGK